MPWLGAAAVKRLLHELLRTESKLFRWLEADPENTQAFLTDPVGTLQQQAPELAPFFAALENKSRK